MRQRKPTNRRTTRQVEATPKFARPPRAERRCEICGNEYDKAMEIVMDGTSHYFDSFECAIHALAPTCTNCGIRIIGHGMEAGGSMFCSAHCAHAKGVEALQDRVTA